MNKTLLTWIFFSQLGLCLVLAPASTYGDDSVGIHGMALFSVNGQLIASHMPLHGGHHSHQVILTLKTDNQESVSDLVQGARLSSLLPEKFSLNKLRNSKLDSFTAKLFEGHFERDGKAYPTPFSFKVTDKLLDQPLKRESNGYYQIVQLNSLSLLVHEIASAPSFDQILVVSANPSSPKEIYSGSEQPLSENNWPESLVKAGIHFESQLYFESQDFQ
ncbi:hypothetical protein [Microbulbifer sp. GL-2]|uniref:hypothetical protein n=1 Tax=Microbulbifer sp. GL-2 TaxID=2591606 RepID=UPI001163CDCE|nr:hypothetical protein [Microbulbifer sp. GL-2]BBM02733.1 hypothetical protein GL2_28070 [Microbulbifer sp. GL-2]